MEERGTKYTTLSILEEKENENIIVAWKHKGMIRKKSSSNLPLFFTFSSTACRPDLMTYISLMEDGGLN